MSEELGVARDSIETDHQIIDIAIGLYEGIPRLNILIRSKVGEEGIQTTRSVKEFGWFTAADLDDLYMSPSTGDIKAKLKEMVSN